MAGAIISYQQTGEVSWKAVAGGAAAGAAIGLGSGAAIAYFAAGSATASTTAVGAGLFTSAAGTATAAGTGAGAAGAGRIWALNPFARGQLIEQLRGHNLPLSFPVIDRWLNGIATSIKSLNLAARSYQSVAALTRTVTGYINALSNFGGYGPGQV